MKSIRDYITLVESAGIPERFPIGIGKRTVPNPGSFSAAIYNGDPDQFDFKKQQKNYEALKQFLANQGKRLTYIGVASEMGEADYTRRIPGVLNATLTSFVAVDDIISPTVVWSKYEGGVAGGGTNKVFIDGQEMKMTQIVEMLKIKELFPKIFPALMTEVKTNPELYFWVRGNEVSIYKVGPELSSILKQYPQFQHDVQYDSWHLTR